MKVKLKDFECKYHDIEFIIDKEDRMIVKPGIHKLEDLVKQYGDYYVWSYKYFDDTETTSVIVGKTDKWDCEEDKTPHFTPEQVQKILANQYKRRNKK